MPHVPAPAPPADRSEGGGSRHGRPGIRTGWAPLTIRARLLGLAVLPAAAVALCAAAALALTATTAPAATWAVLTAAVLSVLAGAAVAGHRTAVNLSGRIVALRRGTARGQAELYDLAEALRRGAPPSARTARPPVPRAAVPDELGRLAADLDRARDAAVAAMLRAAWRAPEDQADGADERGRGQGTRAGSAAGGPAGRGGDLTQLAQTVAVSTHLARRMQSLVHRGIAVLDDLEKDIEDPDLLQGLFQVDHLATRLRRHAENAAVLGGAPARRRWSRPVPLIEVLRSAMAEIEQYQRVVLVPPLDGSVRGHAVTDVAHVLAELIENATVFSAPGTHVMLRTAAVTAGLAVEVEDRGLGMAAHERARMNMLLTDPAGTDVTTLLHSGRTGLYVVSRLARRHGISVRLQSNIYGGVQAVLVLPRALLGAEASPAAAEGGTRRLQPMAAPSGPTGARPLPGGPAHAQPGGALPEEAAREHTAEATAAVHGIATPPEPARPRPAPGVHTGIAPDVHSAGVAPAAHSTGGGSGAHAGVAPGAAPEGAQPRTPGSGTPAPAVAPPAAGHGGSARATGMPRTSAPGGPVPAARPGPDARTPAAAARPTASAPREGAGLPRRHAQEHMAPPPLGGPETRPAGQRATTGPNPELMAAFRRGSDLGAAQRGSEAGPGAGPGGS
ncbi:ATP-binding protein [Streptomyces sp. TS71-3]|uniref:sensor histidine kinase n=1 Tax=Streptomyces sp. TS71-3 TaxID=2733862 RepID=UPI001B12C9FA|nr:ATP-binding protein [Streptomyces sp. TS71-3]GHJ41875.1 ATPase [Streptomyces sp. TS71-3]